MLLTAPRYRGPLRARGGTVAASTLLGAAAWSALGRGLAPGASSLPEVAPLDPAVVTPAAGLLVATCLTAAVGGLGEAPRGRALLTLLGPAILLALLQGTPLGLDRFPEPTPAAMVLLGLGAAGGALAPAGPAGAGVLLAAGVRRAALLVVLGWFLDGAAAGWGVLRPIPPWPPGVAALLLDLSPTALLMEAGGVDWMRDPAVYDAVGTDRLGPGIRPVRSAPVAGTTTLLVGYGLLALRLWRLRRPSGPRHGSAAPAPSPTRSR